MDILGESLRQSVESHLSRIGNEGEYGMPRVKVYSFQYGTGELLA